MLYLQIKNNVKSKIILDDYKNRTHYKVLREFFDIENIGRLAILNKKNKKYNILRIENLIKNIQMTRDKLIKLIAGVILFVFITVFSINFFGAIIQNKVVST